MSNPRSLIAMLCVVSMVLCVTDAAASSHPPVKPPTKRTQVIRAETYKKMEVVQKAFEAKDYKGALAGLDELKNGFDKLNDYEKATVWSLYGAVYYAQSDTKAAINAYINELRQPNLPDGLRDSGLYTLGQLYFITEEYPKAIAVIRKWMSGLTTPQPDGYVLIAQAYYQLENYAASEQSLVEGLRVAKQNKIAFRENWLSLLRAVLYEQKQYAKSAKVLEVLVTQYPNNASYWQQLAGMDGILDRQADQLKIMHAAYRAGLLKNESDLLNLARLYMVENVPYPAAELLAKGMKAKVIAVNADTLQLYAQALVLAKEYQNQIVVLKKLAGMTDESKHYVYLAQAYDQINDWDNAASAFSAALKAKNVTKPAEVRVQLGTALYNAGKLEEARTIFISAAKVPATAEVAGNWVKFVSTEIQQKKALRK